MLAGFLGSALAVSLVPQHGTATAPVRAMLALAAATALAGGGRIEAEAWREVAGNQACGLAAVALTSLGVLRPARPQVGGGR